MERQERPARTTSNTALKISEKSIQNEIIRRLGQDKRVRIWRQNTGAARIGDAYVRFGLPGQADITGWIVGSGRRIEIEVKTPGGAQSQDQKNFQHLCDAHGVLYVLARSVDDAVSAIDGACAKPS